jgi:hypothetical protein
MSTVANTPSHIASFDGNSLNAIAGLSVLSVDAWKPPKRSLSLYNIARTNKSKNSSAFYTEKYVVLRCSITRDTRALAEVSLNSLMTILQGLEKSLVVPGAGTQESFICTYQDFVPKVGGGAYMEFDLVFACSDRFGYETTLTLLKQVSNYTSSTRSDSFTVGGSAPWQQPVITYTVNSVTGGTNATVTFGNDLTGQVVTITRTWTAGDVLVIDKPNGTVKVNGIDVVFTGGIPEWAPSINGSLGYLTYSDTFTARDVSYNAIHYRRYI